MDMKDIITKVSELTGICMSDILSKKRTGEVCEARKIFIYISWKRLGVSHTSIALFTDRTQQNISAQMLDFDQQLRIYRGLKKKVDMIEEEIFPKDERIESQKVIC